MESKPNRILTLKCSSGYVLLDLHTFEKRQIPIDAYTQDIVQGLTEELLNNEVPYQSRLACVDNVADEPLLQPTIVTSFSCNYSCEYCYQHDPQNFSRKSRMLSSDLVAIHSFYEKYCEQYSLPLHYGKIRIIGGEPFLPENKATIFAAGDMWRKQEFIFTTNGTYIDLYYDFFERYQSTVRVSIDGTKEMHYSSRKTNDPFAYDRAIDSIKQLLAFGTRVVIMSVFPEDIKPDYTSFFDELQELGWLSNPLLSVAFIPEFGHGCDDLKMENILHAINVYRDLLEKDYRAKFVDVRKLFPGYINLLETIHMAEQGSYSPYRCGALNGTSFAFLPDGTVRACLLMPDNNNTNIGYFKPEISINTDVLLKLQERQYNLMVQCSSCFMRAACKGGCVATAFNYTGDISKTYCSFWKHPELLNIFYD